MNNLKNNYIIIYIQEEKEEEEEEGDALDLLSAKLADDPDA
jgi:hypothetical protein